MGNKLGIIVPYRDRYEHLLMFKSAINDYLTSRNINFELIIVEQDKAKLFNRGKLLNIGFKQAKKLKCNYIALHDIDMIPVDVDYSYSEVPLLLATQRASFAEFFSSVVLFPIEYFEKVNGYSNEYWGWGFEDDDLLYRCVVNNIPLEEKEVKQTSKYTAALKFNGHNALVESLFRPREEASIFISFELQDLVLDHTKYDDEFVIFNLPKFDLKIVYDSYGKYKVLVRDSKDTLLYINSERLTPDKTNLTLTVGNNQIELYQNGVKIGSVHYTELKNNPDRNFYLGESFKGLIYSLAIYDKVLTENEIQEISENKHFGLTYFESSQNLKTYYESNFIKNYQLVDLSDNRNRGKINNCEVVKCTINVNSTVKLPFRRFSKFNILDHSSNGFVNGGWKDINTRYNQLKFTNEASKGYIDFKNDGLSSCSYTVYSESHVNNQTHLVVSI